MTLVSCNVGDFSPTLPSVVEPGGHQHDRVEHVEKKLHPLPDALSARRLERPGVLLLLLLLL